MKVLIFLFVAIVGGPPEAVAAKPAQRPDLPTGAEVLAGFRQNQEAFKTLRVIWRMETKPAAGRYELLASSIKWREEEIARGKVPEFYKGKPEAYWESQKAALSALRFEADPQNAEKFIRPIYQDYRTDWRGFQIRTQRTFAEYERPAPDFRFPDVEFSQLAPEAVGRYFGNFYMLSFDPDARVPYSRWAGVGPDGANAIQIMSKRLDEFWVRFPPLAMRDGLVQPDMFGLNVNWIDHFFCGEPEEYEVVPPEGKWDGTLIDVKRVLYKVKTVHSFLPVEYHAEFDGRAEIWSVATATVDCSRAGCQ
ncbi:MAG TPA: hypothetical protein PKD86_10470 [Gemmatales bacterium]|nr:hypothetical protein [Gemmatales bacterium]HMP59768.1 hypothetical protein [Gemmatales bacterium]